MDYQRDLPPRYPGAPGGDFASRNYLQGSRGSNQDLPPDSFQQRWQQRGFQNAYLGLNGSQSAGDMPQGYSPQKSNLISAASSHLQGLRLQGYGAPSAYGSKPAAGISANNSILSNSRSDKSLGLPSVPGDRHQQFSNVYQFSKNLDRMINDKQRTSNNNLALLGAHGGHGAGQYFQNRPNAQMFTHNPQALKPPMAPKQSQLPPLRTSDSQSSLAGRERSSRLTNPYMNYQIPSRPQDHQAYAQPSFAKQLEHPRRVAHPYSADGLKAVSSQPKLLGEVDEQAVAHRQVFDPAMPSHHLNSKNFMNAQQQEVPPQPHAQQPQQQVVAQLQGYKKVEYFEQTLRNRAYANQKAAKQRKMERKNKLSQVLMQEIQY